jgi:hypothetical protein
LKGKKMNDQVTLIEELNDQSDKLRALSDGLGGYKSIPSVEMTIRYALLTAANLMDEAADAIKEFLVVST